MKTTKHLPAFPGASEPEFIIGVNLKKDFEAHYGLVRNCQSYEDFARMVKPIPDAIRHEIAEAYARLRASGWYTGGLDKHGRIIWLYQVDSRMPAMRDLGRIDRDGNNLDGVIYSKEECNLARAQVHRRMGKASGGLPKCEPWDYEEGDSGR